MTTIMNLPKEIITVILKCQIISIKDIVNFNSTCKQFRYMNYNNEFWKKKFSQRWPFARRAYDKQEKDECYHTDFLKHIKTSMRCIKETWHYISCMSERHYYYNDIYNKDLRDFNLMLHVFHNCSMNRYILTDELVGSLFKQSLRESSCNLTQRYYGIKVLQYVLQFILTEKWEEFKNRPEKQQLLEKIMTIMMQWYEPYKCISFSYIEILLDKIVQEVLKCLKKEHPEHLIFSIPAKQFSFWKHNNINSSYWNETESEQIKYILHTVMSNVDKLNYPWIHKILKSNEENMYYINMKLENLLDLIFWRDAFALIIYHSAARRLGIHCELIQQINHPFEYSLIHVVWKPSNECFYTDWSSTKSRIILKKCQVFPQACDKITLQMITNRLSYMDFNERAPNNIINRLYQEIKPYIENMYESSVLPIEELPKRRSKKIKFLIGMIVIYNRNHNRNRNNDKVGVIIGWHDSFNFELIKYRSFESNMTICEYSTHKNCIEFQPYYLILGENNKICYVAQKNIICHTSKWINNMEIGRYFCRFEDTHYVPNEMLAKHYPSDTALIKLKIISKYSL